MSIYIANGHSTFSFPVSLEQVKVELTHQLAGVRVISPVNDDILVPDLSLEFLECYTKEFLVNIERRSNHMLQGTTLDTRENVEVDFFSQLLIICKYDSTSWAT